MMDAKTRNAIERYLRAPGHELGRGIYTAWLRESLGEIQHWQDQFSSSQHTNAVLAEEIERLREAPGKQLQWVETLRRLQRIDPMALDLVQSNIEAALKERGDG